MDTAVMDRPEVAEQVDEIPEFDDVSWEEQMSRAFGNGTSSVRLARIHVGVPIPTEPPGKALWLIVRRALCMVIAGFDTHYGVDVKRGGK